MRSRVLMLVGVIAVFAGCRSGNFKTAKVTGKLTVGGKAVTNGDVMVMPLGKDANEQSGKAARAQIRPDGTYSLTTYDAFDGAVIGKHQVTTFNPGTPVNPDPNLDDEASRPSLLSSEEFAALKKPKEVEVKSGSNELNLEY